MSLVEEDSSKPKEHPNDKLSREKNGESASLGWGLVFWENETAREILCFSVDYLCSSKQNGGANI